MAVLNEEVKLFIVQSLACFDTPSQVAEAVAEEFGIKVDRFQVHKYDPTKVNGKGVSKKLVAIFEVTRQAFLKDVAKIPIASQSFRLRSLQRMHDHHISRKNYVQAQAVLEQAAKEVGGIFTNKVKVASDPNDPFVMFIQQVSGTALPVVPDTDT